MILLQYQTWIHSQKSRNCNLVSGYYKRGIRSAVSISMWRCKPSRYRFLSALTANTSPLQSLQSSSPTSHSKFTQQFACMIGSLWCSTWKVTIREGLAVWWETERHYFKHSLALVCCKITSINRTTITIAAIAVLSTCYCRNWENVRFDTSLARDCFPHFLRNENKRVFNRAFDHLLCAMPIVNLDIP